MMPYEQAVTMRVKTIVVIDDEADLVDLTVMLLEAAGHRVVGSTDSFQAVGLVIREGAEIVVLDFEMPGMDGGDVAKALRAEPRTQGIRIVFLSGTAEAEIRRSCTQYDAFLRKPATSKALFAAVA